MKYAITASKIIAILLIIAILPYPVTGASNEAESWTTVPIPLEGRSGNWKLVDNTEISCLRQSSSGTLYCHACPAGADFTLFKSTDAGKNWESTGNIKDDIIDISCVPGRENLIYYATSNYLYKSSDSGETFSILPYKPGNAGMGNISITAIDAFNFSDNILIAAATRDADTGEFGGVYLYDESNPDPLTGWTDTSIGEYDVYDVAFSPSLIVGRWHVAAVVSDETQTLVRIKIADTDWGSLISDTHLLNDDVIGASLVFPANYGMSQSDFTIIVGLNTGTGSGDLFAAYAGVIPEVSSSVAFNVNRMSGAGHADISAIAVLGESRSASLVAGAVDGAVYSSRDGGATWNRSEKPPGGTAISSLLFPRDLAMSGTVYATASGSGGGFALSTNFGSTWQADSFIDTQISALVDFAVSPEYETDKTIFLLTFGSGKHTLWKIQDAGSSWERVFGSYIENVDSIDYVRISPEYGHKKNAVFVSGASKDKPVVWESLDGGCSFSTSRPTYDPESSQPIEIKQIAVINDNKIAIATYEGTEGMLFTSPDAGRNWDRTGATLGTAVPCSIAISPDFTEDKTILVGDLAGGVFISTDGGVILH